MNGDALNTLPAIAAGALVLLAILALLVAVCLPREKRPAISGHPGRRWII
jgi:hypothetical protein